MASSLPLLVLLLCTLNVAHSQFRIYNLRATDLPSNFFAKTDAYVKVSLASFELGKTSVKKDNTDPWWSEEYSYSNAQQGDMLQLEVHDSDVIFDDLLGVCQRNVVVGTYNQNCDLVKGGTLHYTYTLQ